MQQVKTIIITGATSGIGKATALLAASHGHQIVLAARKEADLKATAERIRQAGGTTVFKPTDVSNKAEVQALIDFALDEYGRIDVLDLNAGVMSFAPLNEVRVDEWEKMIDINVKGVLYGLAATIPVMEKQQSGQIIATDSTAGHQVGQNNTVYASTKFSVRAIMDGVRAEEAKSHIRTMMVSPAFVKTGFFEDQRNANLKRVPKLRPEDIAASVVFAIEQPDNVDINEIVLRPTL
ncbi:SDR family oxidoreductase [Lactiplantibacillus nangangensis]|uniref:SDR family oxidoreductase n=1 Tax=Lactiplantibacillus nangangensis TaxID=2559917 RepID=A0ABW1SFI4_9LACO|nr:SDR family oxidoreductase [Lactiplantibacillus nangangensis]